MNDGDNSARDRRYIVDCAGLHEIATTSSNSLKAACLDLLAQGVIAVPARVWQEFKEIYEDEAEELEAYVADRIRLTRVYRQGVARMAEKSNSSLNLSPYDMHSDLYAAAIAFVEGLTVLTTTNHVVFYEQLEEGEAAELSIVLGD